MYIRNHELLLAIMKMIQAMSLSFLAVSLLRGNLSLILIFSDHISSNLLKRVYLIENVSYKVLKSSARAGSSFKEFNAFLKVC